MSVAAAGIAGMAMSMSTDDARAQLAVSCGGTIQNCPQGKEMNCNRWRNCKGRNAKVKRYCDAPICMTKKQGGKE